MITEFPEDVWNTSSWYAPLIVNKRLKEMALSGKKLPNENTVTETVQEIKELIARNGGLSAQMTLNFDNLLERLESR